MRMKLCQVVILMLSSLQVTVGTHLSHCDPANRITVCEWKRAKIHWGTYCPFYQKDAVEATWGRTDNVTCVDRVPYRFLQNTTCPGDDDLAAKAVTDWCNSHFSRGSCKIRAAVRKLRIDGQPYDPCQGTFKYLTLCHYCKTLDACEPNPCQNGGVCTGGFEDYTCSCPDGYLGDDCEIIDHCVPNPCGSHGSCNNSVDGYRCFCQLGYTGQHCETVIDPCVPNPCPNGASCVSDVYWDYTCNCPHGYTGESCDKIDCPNDGPLMYDVLPGAYSASSTLSEEFPPYRSNGHDNLYAPTFWSPAVSEKGEWVQVRFPSPRYICEIDVYLGNVTQYQIATSMDCQTFSVIKDQLGHDVVFDLELAAGRTSTSHGERIDPGPADKALCARFIIYDLIGWPFLNVDYFGVMLE